jgi:hypothetical protein
VLRPYGDELTMLDPRKDEPVADAGAPPADEIPVPDSF